MNRKSEDVLVYKYTQQLYETGVRHSGQAQEALCIDILINLLYDLGYDDVIKVYDEVVG